MSDFEDKNNPMNSDNNGSAAGRPPSPRSRFNFSNNRLAAPETAPAAAPERAPVKSSALSRNNTPKLKQIFGKGKELLEQERSPLVFNVAQLLRDPVGSTRDYDVEADELDLSSQTETGEKQVARDIQGHVRFTKALKEILVQGKFQAEVNMACVRCLEDFDSLIEVELEEEYTPSIEVVTGLPVRLEDSDDEEKLKIDPNHMLNLGEGLRQQILVSLPMHPLCRPDCPGLYDYVAQANADVPEAAPAEAEADKVQDVDKRWAALSKLQLPNRDNEEN